MTIDPTEKEYNIKVKVNVIDTQLTDSKNVKHATQVVRLTFVESRDLYKFLTAWLPDTEDEGFELIVFLHHPILSPCRVKIFRSGPKFNKHNFFVMSKGVEDILVKLEGKTINCDVLPASQEAEVDDAIGSEISYETI